MRRPLAAAVLALALVAAPGRAAAGPWTQPEGEAYVKAWLKYLFGFGFFIDDQSRGYGTYQELFLNAYGEVGLTDGVTLTAHLPLLQAFLLEDPRDGSFGDHFTIGDPTLGLRFRLLTVDRFVSALEVGVRAPLATPGPQQPVFGTEEGNPRLGDLRIGSGAFDLASNLGVGYAGDAFYLAASGGYVLRSEGYDHVLSWTAEGGAQFDGWALRARATGYHSLGVWIGERAPLHRSPSGMGNGTNYIGAAFEIEWEIERDLFFGLTVEGGLGALDRQTGGPVVSVFVARRLGR